MVIKDTQEKNTNIFRCPATSLSDDTCDTVWPYELVRSAANLEREEKQEIERKMGQIMAGKPCPNCHRYCVNI